MELTRDHFRATIFYNFRRGLSRQECIDELKALFGDKTPSYSTVKNWFNEFNCVRWSLKDDTHEGRPKTAFMSDNPDLAPNDFFLYRHIKKILRGQRFSPNTNFSKLVFSSKHCKQYK